MKILTMILLGCSLLFGAVDINTAGKKELSTLDGVGDKKADAILAYRAGKCFKSVEELAQVKGIGEKIISKNKDNITLGECKKK